MAPPTPSAALSQRVTRSKRANLDQQSASSQLSGSSTATTSHRKPSAATLSSMSLVDINVAAAKAMMPPPSAIPPPRSALTKAPSVFLTSSTSSSSKENSASIARPAKKLATEASLSTVSRIPTAGAGSNRTRMGSAAVPTTPVRSTLAGSRGSSSSPQHKSPSFRPIVRIPVVNTSKKAAPAKPKTAEIGATTEGRRLRAPTSSRSSRLDGAPPKTPHSQSGSSSQSRSKGPSKSGVESSTGNHVPRPEPIQSVVQLPPPLPTVLPEILPPVPVVPDRTPELELELTELRTKLADTSVQYQEDFDRLRHEKVSLEQQFECVRQEKSQLEEEKENFRAEKILLEQDLEKVRQEKSQLDSRLAATLTQLQASSECNSKLQGEALLNSQTSQLQVEEIRIQQERLSKLAVEISELTERIAQFDSEKAALLADLTASHVKVTEMEKGLAKAHDELDGLRKELAGAKRKHKEECARAVEQVADLTKQLQIKVNEAESWKTVMELKQQDVKRLQGEVESAHVQIERQSVREKELCLSKMKIEDLEMKVQLTVTAEKKLRRQIEEKDGELCEWKRRSMVISQDRDALKFQLDSSRLDESRIGDVV